MLGAKKIVMKIQQRNIADVHPYEKNSKKHPDDQVRKVMDSIQAFGFNQPIVVDKEGVIIVGHGRYLAAHLLGMDEVPVLEVSLTEDQATAYRIADNKLNESEWDMNVTIEELKSLSEDMVELTGFSREDFDGKVLSQEIDQLSRERNIDLGKYNVITVEAPESPRLKARMSFYFESIEDFERVKRFFKLQGGELDASKLLTMTKGND